MGNSEGPSYVSRDEPAGLLLKSRVVKRERVSVARDIRMMKMAPADVAGALTARASDAFSIGEPYRSQAEMIGFGCTLFQAHDYWPDHRSLRSAADFVGRFYYIEGPKLLR